MLRHVRAIISRRLPGGLSDVSSAAAVATFKRNALIRRPTPPRRASENWEEATAATRSVVIADNGACDGVR